MHGHMNVKNNAENLLKSWKKLFLKKALASWSYFSIDFNQLIAVIYMQYIYCKAETEILLS